MKTVAHRIARTAFQFRRRMTIWNAIKANIHCQPRAARVAHISYQFKLRFFLFHFFSLAPVISIGIFSPIASALRAGKLFISILCGMEIGSCHLPHNDWLSHYSIEHSDCRNIRRAQSRLEDERRKILAVSYDMEQLIWMASMCSFYSGLLKNVGGTQRKPNRIEQWADPPHWARTNSFFLTKKFGLDGTGLRHRWAMPNIIDIDWNCKCIIIVIMILLRPQHGYTIPFEFSDCDYQNTTIRQQIAVEI